MSSPASSSPFAGGSSLLVLEPRRSSLRVRPSLVIQAMLLVLVIGNVGRIPLLSAGDRSIPLLINDLAAVGVVIVGALYAAQRRTLRLDAVALLGFAFAAIGGLSALAAQARFGLTYGELAVALAFLARWLLYFALYVVAINTLRRQDVRPVWRAFDTCALLFAGFGIFQAAFLPGFAQMVYPDAAAGAWDVQGHRLVSTFLDPNFAGALIMMALLVELALLSSGERLAIWKPLLLVVAMVLTLSRGTLLAFGIGLTVIIVVRGVSRRMMLLLAAIAGGVALELPRILAFARSFNKLEISDPSAQARFIVWARGLIALRDHPVIGIGFNTWSAVQRRYGWETAGGAQFGIDGGILFIAVLTGAVGVTVYLWMLGYAFVRSRATWRDATRATFERGLAAGIGASLVALCVHSLFTNSLLHPFLMEPLWILCALGFVMARAPLSEP